MRVPLRARTLRAELYLAVAERDEWHTAETTARLEEAFTAAGLRHVIEPYPDASERHLERVMALFARRREG